CPHYKAIVSNYQYYKMFIFRNNACLHISRQNRPNCFSWNRLAQIVRVNIRFIFQKNWTTRTGVRISYLGTVSGPLRSGETARREPAEALPRQHTDNCNRLPPRSPKDRGGRCQTCCSCCWGRPAVLFPCAGGQCGRPRGCRERTS